MTPAEKVEPSRLLSILSKGQKQKKSSRTNKQHVTVSAADSLRGILRAKQQKKVSSSSSRRGTPKTRAKKKVRKEEATVPRRKVVVTDFGSSPSPAENEMGGTKWRENRVQVQQPHYNHYGECLPGREYSCDDIPKEKFNGVHCKHGASGYF